jgi:BirA family biotin operon repressor/biotin-[acetyl-CoA-carboxylase] ligase
MPDAAQLGFLPVIAASKTLDYLLGTSPNFSYKWPNDLLLNKKKIGGTLLEAGFDQKTKKIWIVVGFGLNLQHFPSSTFFPATSIRDETGRDLKIEEVVELYLQNLSGLYSDWQDMGFQPVRKEWLNRGHGINETLCVKLGNKNLFGFFRDLDGTGALVIETSKGSHRVSAGDVYLIPMTGEL